MVRLAISERRTLLIEAAWRVLQRDGVRAATTRAICAEARMPQSSFHYCFESRTELFREIVISLVPRQIEGTLAALDLSDDRYGSDNFVLGPMHAFLDEVEENPMRHAVLYDITLNSIYDSDLTDLAQYQYAEYLKAAVMVLERGAERMGFTWDLPVEALATTMLSFLDGIVLRYVVDRHAARARAAVDAFGRDFARHAKHA